MTLEEVLKRLKSLADPEKISYKEKKFGVHSSNALGIYMKELNALAKEIGKDELLAVQLFDSGIYEAKILCSKIFRPKHLSEQLAEKWILHFENWEICDSFCMGIIAKSPLAQVKIDTWTLRENEFERRAGFATMAAYCMADKIAPNEVFVSFLPHIVHAATDHRLYVKKAVNWALRNIGKRNKDLKIAAIQTAHQLLTLNSANANWIAKDALKELERENVRMSDYPRTIYRIHA